MQKLYGFGLENGIYGIATDKEIQEMCKDWNTKIYNKDLATYKEVIDYLCWDGELLTNTFLAVKDGYVFINPNTDEVDFYNNKITCLQMLKGILETYM